MVAMLQRLDARRFFFRSQLSVCSFLAFFLKVFRNRLSCHGVSVAELVESSLCHFGHSLSAVHVFRHLTKAWWEYASATIWTCDSRRCRAQPYADPL